MTSSPDPRNYGLTTTWYAQPDDLIGGWCVMPSEQPPSAGGPQLADFTSQQIAEHVAGLHNEWLEGPGAGPVQQLRNIADHAIGGNVPYLADLIHAAATRLEEEMAGPGGPLDEIVACRRDDLDLVLNLLDRAGADGAEGARERLSAAVTAGL